MTPLSHHEILRHVGPFARAGRQVDLALSDRASRVLVFKPVVHPPTGAAAVPIQLTENLRLDLGSSPARLRRTVATDDGLQATLSASDTDLEALLGRVLAVSPATHFRFVDHLLIADSYRCSDDPAQGLELRESHAQVRGIEIQLDARTVAGAPMPVTLAPPDRQVRPVLPKDLFAVLGRPWKLLRSRESGWEFLLYAPSREPKRSLATQTRFALAVTHLDRVLGEAPVAFHQVHRAARWRVWLRRLVPLALCGVVIAALPLIDRFYLSGDVTMNPLIFGIPNFLILAFMYMSRHEMLALELPSFPRPLAPEAWSSADAVGNSATPASQPEGHSHG